MTTAARRRPEKSSAWWLTSSLAPGCVYLSMLQPGMDRMVPLFRQPLVAVRTAGDPLAVVPFLREVLTDASSGRARQRYPARVIHRGSGRAAPLLRPLRRDPFAAVALLLAAFGLYSMLSYTVSQRRREASAWLWGPDTEPSSCSYSGRAPCSSAPARLMGLLAAAATTRIVESILFGVTPADPLTFAAVTAVLFAGGLVACWLPARRATRSRSPVWLLPNSQTFNHPDC